ncbi:hypothetical protein [Colwellia psychrerythraea]|uniref:Uncharacterized protein n=1 Tax=Colwellia psychrerythraea TaxID=28229 RepID=A0A099KR81_COLPS|nr:hypothetical protein [Colwellia psychrerythraea]KGJ92128.1 hypothetical protein ND2E_3021 [Colwellia psychrerythraea]
MTDEKKKAFIANWPVKHDKKLYQPGTEQKPLMLTKDQAAALLTLGAISELDEQPKQDGGLTDELSQEQQLATVVTAIGTMDLSLKENIIGNGSPDAGKLTELVGFTVSAAMRNEAWAQAQTNTSTEGEKA